MHSSYSQVEEESKALKSHFKANPARVLQQEPFCPQRSSKPLTGTAKETESSPNNVPSNVIVM